MSLCRTAGSLLFKPSSAHTPQPDDPPPGEPDGPDVPPIGDPPPEPDEAPRSSSRRPQLPRRPGRAAVMRWARWVARTG
jgi:hypothetical protein